MKKEIWKDVVGFEGFYQVSNFGDVVSVRRRDSNGVPRGGHVMKQSTNCRSEYRDVGLRKNGGSKRVKVHVLVTAAFHGPKPSASHECRHRNGNKLDNSETNLCWGTVRENADDKIAHGTTPKGEKNGGGGKLTTAQVLSIKARLALGEAGTSIARSVGVTKGMIYAIAKGRAWSHV